MQESSMTGIIERIKRKREELKYSYQDLAELTHMSKSTLQRYETGRIKNLPLDKLIILANALETTPEYIMGWEEKKMPTIENNGEPKFESDEDKALFEMIKKLDRKRLIKAILYFQELFEEQNNENE